MQSGRNLPTFRKYLLPLSLGDRTDDGASKRLWIVGQFLPDYTGQRPRQRLFSYSPWEPETHQDMLNYRVIILLRVSIKLPLIFTGPYTFVREYISLYYVGLNESEVN